MASYPLFPLPVVLFPGAMMPLHIFEPRYRELLADCAADGHRFVILPPLPDDGVPTPGVVGTVAKILAIQPLPEGRSNVVVTGEDRVALQTIEPGDRPYLTGRFEAIADEAEARVPGQDDLARIRDLAQRYAAALGTIAEVEREPDLSEEPGLLSFQIAALVDWDQPTKHRFLAIRSAFERITRLLQTLPKLVAEIERRAEVHQRAPTNGKGPSGP